MGGGGDLPVSHAHVVDETKTAHELSEEISSDDFRQTSPLFAVATTCNPLVIP